MRHSKAKKAENRDVILTAAARLFRERGIHDVSVAMVMEAADMTHGGFYRHFADKADLVTHAVAGVLDRSNDEYREAAGDLGAFVATYLTMEHRDHPGDGCAFAALGPEIVRGPAATRRVMTEAIRRQIKAFAQSAPGDSGDERRRAAIGSWSAMIGALVLSRISDDSSLAEEILDGALSWTSKQGRAHRV